VSSERAGIVENLKEYPWSSYRFRAYGEESKILDYDPWYKDLAREGLMRQERYRKFFQEVIARRRAEADQGKGQ